jgi:hypothetical protein
VGLRHEWMQEGVEVKFSTSLARLNGRYGHAEINLIHINYLLFIQRAKVWNRLLIEQVIWQHVQSVKY